MMNIIGRYRIAAVVSLLFLVACGGKDKLFEEVSTSHSNIEFSNELVETEDLNVFLYDYIYNGAGVAVGDVNRDGLVDIYFNGNAVKNRLYLNTGDMEFEDITRASGLVEKDGWKTGVSMVDVNGDGWLDIYVCYAGLEDFDRSNQLFVNNGIDESGKVSFSEKAKEFGVDAPGTFSTQSYFFDYDIDGDLDFFLLNHGIDYNSSFANAIQRPRERHAEFGNRFYRNDGGHFTDMSSAIGIAGGWLNYGLSASIGDFNGDSFPDLYVSNDFDERDFFYINTGDGSFKECLKESFAHISKFTMGTDAADINNDGRVDLVTLDMLPEDNYRQKILKGPDAFDKYDYFVKRGFHHQQMRNMLQLNVGLDQKGLPVFSEIGQLAGISNTDWSWASLFADFDNDGFKDLLITNGYLRDFTNLDFQKFDFEDARRRMMARGIDMKSPEGKKFLFEYVNNMASIKVRNYLFQNKSDLTFEDKSLEWGFDQATLSNGAAFADFDNDGDLDIVVNNLNQTAGLFRNNSEELIKNDFVRVRLTGGNKNTQAIGAKVRLRTSDGKEQFAEANYSRGFLSSVEPVIHFGLGKGRSVDLVEVVWPDGMVSRIPTPGVNKTISVDYGTAQKILAENKRKSTPVFKEISDSVNIGFSHLENNFIDFRNERLLLFKLSSQGPEIVVGDVNSDGSSDVFITGASGQSSKLYLQSTAGFAESKSQPWEADISAQDVGALFFDSDGDKDLDLYVVSGGNEFAQSSPNYHDRLYLNDGKGNFKKDTAAIPERVGGGSCVAGADFDKDGDIDLFVGGWTLPGSYPLCSASRILRNDSDKSVVKFVDVTSTLVPELGKIGVTRDALWQDVDNDGMPELIIASDWQPLRIYKNTGTRLIEVTSQSFPESVSGFWNSLTPADVDHDGDIDLIAGNMGLNSDLNASPTEPVEMYYGDFNNDGRIDPLVCSYVQGKSYPIASRDELLGQMLPLRKKFVRYSQYATATIKDILDSAQLRKAQVLRVSELRSCLFRNNGNGRFDLEPLPLEAQFAPIQSVVADDFDGDSNIDLLTAGNFYPYRAEFGPFDASTGVLLRGDNQGHFKSVPAAESGLLMRGDVRCITMIKAGKRDLVLVGTNNGKTQVLTSR